MENMEVVSIVASGGDKPEPERRRVELVKGLLKRIEAAERHHEKAFARMKRNMELAYKGYGEDWDSEKYVANIIQRHVQQRTAALYAKNPKAAAKRRARLDYEVWDGDAQKLQIAMQNVAQAQQVGVPPPAASQMLLQDYNRGQAARDRLDRVARTLEILFEYYMAESEPSFKSQMKALVRRVITTGVGYVKVGFQREMDHHPEIASKIADTMARIDHLRRIAEEMAEGDIKKDDPEVEELMLSLEALSKEEMIILREGLVFDFPECDAIIVDPMCRQLRGFVGARWIAHKLFLTPDEVKEIYGKDLKDIGYTTYDTKGKSQGKGSKTANNRARAALSDADAETPSLACIYELFDKPSGLRYVLVDGGKDFLEEPAAPKFPVQSFWPVYALVFNETEHKERLFPPSDVELLEPMQAEYNRARQALREHRRANRPKYGVPAGVLEEEDKAKLRTHPANAVIELQALATGQKVDDVIQPIKSIGIDPNLYEVKTLFDDVQLVVGAQEATFGGVSSATATETSIAESARTSALGAQIDELDSFMSDVARAAGQILLAEMSAEQVRKIVGDGAAWPELSNAEIQEEVFLEIEAGSTGKPNKAAELRNLERILPYLIQIPGIKPEWLGKEVLKRMDDKLDLGEAIAEGIPSIVAANAAKGAAPMEGGADQPMMQGAQGAQNGMPNLRMVAGGTPTTGGI